MIIRQNKKIKAEVQLNNKSTDKIGLDNMISQINYLPLYSRSMLYDNNTKSNNIQKSLDILFRLK
jgi:hypothetical protein